MSLAALMETKVQTAEGSIDRPVLYRLIASAMKQSNVTPAKFRNVQELVEAHYSAGDISQVTKQDIVDIITAAEI